MGWKEVCEPGAGDIRDHGSALEVSKDSDEEREDELSGIIKSQKSKSFQECMEKCS